MSHRIVGIDLGTTYSLVAVMQGTTPVVLPNALGEVLTPSAVSIDERGVISVGAAARARATTHPDRTALAFKRDMGTNSSVEIGGKRFTAPELSSLVLRSLRADAESALGEAVEEAVVTVPAYFGDAQRQATRDAAAIAGLRVERIINEPTAAALAYGLHQREREFRALVLDLGGGTFDVTVLEIIEGVIEIQGSSGDTRLGGDDFDEALAEHLAARARSEWGVDAHADAQTWSRFRDAAELAKRRLSDVTETRAGIVQLRAGRNVVDIELTITRAAAEEVWAPCLARLDIPIRRALKDAGARPETIDEVLLVGGSTRMPCIAQFAARTFGRLPLRKLPPDEAVAFGAAVQGALKARDVAVKDVVVTDIAPFSLGITSGADIGGQQIDDLFVPILERGTVIPASRVKPFRTMSAFQQFILIEVYQGEHSTSSRNTKLGEYRVEVPPRPAGEEAVDVRFSYDLNGILEVETTVLSTGKTCTLVLERAPGRLSKKEIETARQSMQRLKLHPRDALPNLAALARADALHLEVIGPAREILGRHIAAFRAALETHDPKTITAYRATLLEVIATLGAQR
jgi:molecular chaperone HscC